MNRMNWAELLNEDRHRTSSVHGDTRTQFERDFDRSVFSNPVKRLQDKAQVFPLDACDAVRTRLTHSLEVSSVARGLGKEVGDWLGREQKDGFPNDVNGSRSVEWICATCGLLHDLGNPPFGHAGEEAISSWFLDRKIKRGAEKAFPTIDNSDDLESDFLKFEGNAQTLRLVSRLQVLADFHGLNLTYGTLSALGKYTTRAFEADPEAKNHAHSKPGFFASEESLVESIRNACKTNMARHPLTFLVEAADDIVYSVADIEDGIKKGILRWSDLESEFRSLGEDLTLKAVQKKKRHILKEDSDKFSDEVNASAFRTAAISVFVASVKDCFEKNYDHIMDGKYLGELVGDCDSQELIGLLKKIPGKKIFSDPSVLKLELMGRQVITDLMDVFWEGAKEMPTEGLPKTKTFPLKAASLLSSNYRKVFQHSVSESKLPELYHRYQLVTDYVCGMTDSFAKRLHAELFNGL